MSPDKAQQIGDSLASLAASLSEIAEEVRTLCGTDYDGAEKSSEPEAQAEVSKSEVPKLEEVRGVLADKATSGFREAVQALIKKYGANRLSDIDPSRYPALLKEAEALK